MEGTIDKAMNNSLDNISIIVEAKVLSKIIYFLEKPFENLSINDADDVFLIEEMSEILIKNLEGSISVIMRLLISNESVDVF